MRVAAAAISSLAICSQLVVAGPRFDPRPRTLDEKIQDAELIVLGTATVFGDRHDLGDSYVRKVRVRVAAALWAEDGLSSTNDIVFPYLILERWPESWWAYTNTPGVFFLIKSVNQSEGEWEKLPYFDDWYQPMTNATAVLLAIEKQKGKTARLGRLNLPQLKYPVDTRYDHTPALRLAYLTEFRKGFYDALIRERGILMFGPMSEKDKAKVAGYADGQLAGDAARLKWMKTASMLMK